MGDVAPGGGQYDPDFLLGATLAQYPTWVLGTVAGVLVGPALDAKALGLDALLPAFFFCLLVAEVRKPGRSSWPRSALAWRRC